jgi:hypothetical protein
MGYYEGEIGSLCGNNNNNGFGSNGWGDLAALIVVAGLFGWGNGGFGFGGGFGGGRGYDYCCGTPATQADLANGFAQNTIQRGIDDIILGQAQAINYNNQGFAGLNSVINSGFAGVNNAICTLGYQNAQLVNGLSRELGDCCCATQRAIDSVKLENERNTCSIINAANANTRAILDFLTTEKISALQAENSGLKAQISNDRQSAYIVSQLKEPCPVPSYIVPNPNCCYDYRVTQNTGCGCGY